MLFFRSEEDIQTWCARTGEPRGETLTLPQVWELAQLWYGDRMDPAFRGRTPAQVHAIFSRLGLSSDFWRP
jgi:hypothetical protein